MPNKHYGNRNRVRSYGVKVSLNAYQKAALDVLEFEHGLTPAALAHMMMMEPDKAFTKKIMAEFRKLEKELIDNDQAKDLTA